MAMDRSLIEDCLASLAMEHGHAINSQLIYRIVLERFFDWLIAKENERAWSDVPIEEVKGYLKFQKETRKLAASSLKIEVIALRHLFRFLKQEQQHPEDLSQQLDLPKLSRNLPEILTEDEVDTLLSVDWGREPQGLRNKAILEVFYSSGLRVSELANLRVEFLDEPEQTLRVLGKGNKERLVLIGSQALLALRSYLQEGRPLLLKEKRAGEIFLATHGGKLTSTRIWEIVKEAMKKAGLTKNVYPHLLRHSFATHMLGRGADLRIIQDLLGHSNIGTTEVYTHIDRPRLLSIHQSFHPRA
jgi:integrase/recombinase XerD